MNSWIITGNGCLIVFGTIGESRISLSYRPPTEEDLSRDPLSRDRNWFWIGYYHYIVQIYFFKFNLSHTQLLSRLILAIDFLITPVWPYSTGSPFHYAPFGSVWLGTTPHSAVQLGVISLRKITLRITSLFQKRFASIRASALARPCFSAQKPPDMFRINRDAHSHALLGFPPVSVSLFLFVSFYLDTCVVTRKANRASLSPDIDVRSSAKCTRRSNIYSYPRGVHARNKLAPSLVAQLGINDRIISNKSLGNYTSFIWRTGQSIRQPAWPATQATQIRDVDVRATRHCDFLTRCVLLVSIS